MFVKFFYISIKNIRLITKFDSWGLLVYLVSTCMIGTDNSRLKELVISLRVSAYIE